MLLRPQSQGGWSMGEVCRLTLDDSCTVYELARRVSELRPHISPRRVQFRLANQKLVSERLFDWSLRRLGIHDEYTVMVEPTHPTGWLWNSEEFYLAALLDRVEATIVEGGRGRVRLADLRLETPPFMRYTLRTLLRQYPERFQLTVNINSGVVTCSLATEEGRTPLWNESSLETVAIKSNSFTY